jgi:hypothetical protein
MKTLADSRFVGGGGEVGCGFGVGGFDGGGEGGGRYYQGLKSGE